MVTVSVGNKGKAKEAEKALLKERALDLAKPEIIAEQEATLEVAVFALGEQLYGFETGKTREIYSVSEITMLPSVPQFYTGIVNIRGQIVALIDLKQFFGLASSQDANAMTKAIIAERQGMTLGFLADKALSSQRIKLSAIQPAEAVLSGIDTRYLQGLTNDRITIIDIDQIFLDPRIYVDEEEQL
jgi:purine-binding chemotaxis protein CheW